MLIETYTAACIQRAAWGVYPLARQIARHFCVRAGAYGEITYRLPGYRCPLLHATPKMTGKPSVVPSCVPLCRGKSQGDGKMFHRDALWLHGSLAGTAEDVLRASLQSQCHKYGKGYSYSIAAHLEKKGISICGIPQACVF